MGIQPVDFREFGELVEEYCRETILCRRMRSIIDIHKNAVISASACAR
ncbi:hypothetical protein [Chlorobaculum tepidum]|nr:hypothetical protein [Chlorobaculum tepidum]